MVSANQWSGAGIMLELVRWRMGCGPEGGYDLARGVDDCT